MNKNSKTALIVKLILAPVAYFIITQVISIVYTIVTMAQKMSDVATQDYMQIYNEVYDLVMDKTLLITLISAVVTIPLIYFVFFDRKEERIGKKINLIYAALFGIGVSIVTNVVVALSGIIELSDTYQELSNYIYTGNVLFEIFTAGIVVPIVEELIYRGVIMKNFNKLLGTWPALIISSLIFGAMHMNLVQFMYATILGFAMGFVYIRYRSIVAPILFHMAANTFSIMISDWTWMSEKMEDPVVSLGVILGCLILTVVSPVLIVRSTANTKEDEIPEKTYIE